MQNLTGKVTGSTLTATEWNQLPQEVQNIIIDTGQSLTSGDIDQLGKGVSTYVGSGDFYIDSGSTNAISLIAFGNLIPPPAYTRGQRVRFRAGATNTGATTINVAGIGSKKVLDQTGAELVAGDITANIPYELFYDPNADGGAGAFILKKGSTAPDVLPRNYIDGMLTRIDSVVSDAIVVSVGEAKMASNDLDVEITSEISKDITVNWALGGSPGTPAGGFPSALTLTNGTFYRIFVIAKPDGTYDAGFDESSVAGNLLSDAAGDGFTKYRQVGWIWYDSGAITPYLQFPDRIFYEQPILEFSGAPTTSASVLAVTVPPDDTCIGEFSVYTVDTGDPNRTFGLLTSTDVPDVAPTSSVFNVSFDDADASQAGRSTNMFVPVAIGSGTGQIRSRWNQLFDNWDLVTTGYIYRRGKE